MPTTTTTLPVQNFANREATLRHWIGQCHRWGHTRLGLWLTNTDEHIDPLMVNALVTEGLARAEYGGLSTFGHVDYYLTVAGIAAGEDLLICDGADATPKGSR